METIFESKLNTMSIEELELIDPNTLGVLINKVLNISSRYNKPQYKELMKLAYSLANNDSGTPNNRLIYNSYIRQDKVTKKWIASRTIRGVRHKKVSIEKNIVQEWYNELCKTENVKP